MNSQDMPISVIGHVSSPETNGEITLSISVDLARWRVQAGVGGYFQVLIVERVSAVVGCRWLVWPVSVVTYDVESGLPS